MNPGDFKRTFMDSLDGHGGIETLFENLPNLSFWIKDADGRFVTANQNVVRMCGRRQESDIIGRTDFDFFPMHTAEAFQRDDLSVVRSRAKIVDRIEPISLEDGSMRWYSTNKVPLYGRDGGVIGVAGTTRELGAGGAPDPVYAEFTEVIEYISRNFSRPIKVDELARMMSLSVSQFERRFKQAFHEAPMRFILKNRVNEACKLLVNTRQPIAWSARATGFFDQSYFSKHFPRSMGMSPRQYREKYYQGS
jgi:PAS domain S-box-containing protein